MFSYLLNSKLKRTLYSISLDLFSIKNFSTVNKCGNFRFLNKLSSVTVNNHHIKVEKLFRNFLSQSNTLYTSSILSSDIPDYLKEIANKISDTQENILEDVEELVNYREDEVAEYLSSRAVSFEELENSFIVACPSCGQSNKSHDMFIDKNSGYCACHLCCLDGKWEDIVEIFDSKEDTLTEQQLEDYFYDLKPVDDTHSTLLSGTPLDGIEISHLKNLEAKINDDKTKIIFPLLGENHETIGFASISLQHKTPQIVQRVLQDRSAIFSGLPIPKTKRTLKRVIIVSSIMDALFLAKYKIHSMVLVSDSKEETLNWAFQWFKSVVFWCKYSDISENLLKYLASKTVDCFVVKKTIDVGNCITSLSENKIARLLTDAMPVLFDASVNCRDIAHTVYDRIINKDEMFGIKWKRFLELNQLLLGHRLGELTVFSGQTGSGKTTFMSEYSLDLCMQGVATLWCSFEINIARLNEVMYQQFSGKSLPHEYSFFKELVDQFSGMPMHFLNLHGQQPLKDVINIMTHEVLMKGIQHVVIDNLQFMLGLHGANSDWWLEQDRAVGAFRQFATTNNCHVTLIVHPRKLNAGEKLNLHSISGGARVTQEADNVMVLHVKENKDGSTNTSGPKTLQIVKNRYGGTLGEMRLRFHKESLTLSSCFRTKNNNEIKQSENNNSNIKNFKGISSLFIEEER